MRQTLGLARSLMVYHRPAHLRAMTAFYRPLVKPGDLVFDVGAHAGDRTRAFLRLGCRVVAVEPQRLFARLLRVSMFGRARAHVIEAALADRPTELTLRINSANPTVSTASDTFIAAAGAAPCGWDGQRWDRARLVPALTLDGLIARFGTPAFTKIDVEGFEDKVLLGLSQALAALSFEFTTLQREVALAALDRVASLGDYRFNACLGESFSFMFAERQSAARLRAWLLALPFHANSGDIYCWRA